MAEPHKPEHKEDAKSGVKDGDTPNTLRQKGAKRPVDEEDTFGGAERAHKGEPIKSPNAKP